MTYGISAVTGIGAGTLQASTSASVVAASPNANTRPYDLVVMVCYTDQDATQVQDTADGWIILNSGYDGTNTYGIFMAALLARTDGASGYAGLTLPGTGAYTAQVYTYRLANPGDRFCLCGKSAADTWYNLTASAVAIQGPTILQPYQQCIDLVGRGYNNAGTTTTMGNITGFTESFDTGQTSPAHGVILNYRLLTNAIQNPAVSGNLAVAKTNRAGVRAMVGLIGNVATRRTMQYRRVF